MLIKLVVQLSLKKSAKIVMLVFSQLSKKYAGLVERASIISFFGIVIEYVEVLETALKRQRVSM